MPYMPPTAIQKEQFHQGKSRHAYQMFGAHPITIKGEAYWQFTLWAPNAKAVSVVGEFCLWNPAPWPMAKQFDGTWELRLPHRLFFPEEGKSEPPKEEQQKNNAPLLPENKDSPTLPDTYKYAILGADDLWHFKADPYGFYSELRPHTASRLYDITGYAWSDQAWLKKRQQWNPYQSPINIYEMHLGSWRRKKDGSFLTYLETADLLIPYLKQMGYTHVELLPVMEHPLDMSWGYQVTGYYAATARYGTPKELMAFVDQCHQEGIGVLLDWVPAHFPRDEVGLRRFDGSPCYEHPDPLRGEMPRWGTQYFDFARGEVCSFLLSNACFWLDYFHVDGLRVDAVSSMLYYDFGKEEGQWLPNQYGGRENLDAIDFLKHMNEVIYRDFPGVIMAAEEASAFPLVTKPTFMGGLGFGFKWNMGWMNDILTYIKTDPLYRKWSHDKITFSLYYAFNENYILPFSHDEVVHGKHSMLDKQPGDIWQKFAGLRALYGYTMAHPGKKLLFMGSEFGHFIEWKYDDQLDWFLLLYQRHPQLHHYVKTLNHFYLNMPSFYEIEDSWDGFQWLVADDSNQSVVAFLRTDKKGNSIACVVNFTPVFHKQYRLGLPHPGTLKEILNSDLDEFGGSNQHNPAIVKSEEVPFHDFSHSISICVPPLSCVYFSYNKKLHKNKLASPGDASPATKTSGTKAAKNSKANNKG